MSLFSSKRTYQTHFLPEVNEKNAKSYTKDFKESFIDEWNYQTYVNNAYSRTDNYHDEFEKDIEQIEKITGESIKNPFNSTWEEFFVEDIGMGLVNQITKNPFNPKSDRFHPENVAKREKERLDKYYSQVNELKAKYPELQVRDFETINADIKKQAREYFDKVNDGRDYSGLGSFLGAAAGSTIDPINMSVTLMTGGTAAAAKTTVLKALGKTAVAEFVANSMAELGIQTNAYKYKKELDIPTSKSEVALNVAAAGVGGAILGTAGEAIHLTGRQVLNKYKTALNKGAKFDGATKEAAALLEQKVDLDDWIKETNPFTNDVQGLDAHTNNVMNELARLTEEQNTLSKAYDDVKVQPVGDPAEHLAEITPEDMEKIWVDRGGYKGNNGVKGSGFGMVKFIFRHGKDEIPVEKADVINFPQVVRDYEPIINDTYGNNRTWSVKRKDGKQIIYADRIFLEDGERHLVTIHVVDKDKQNHNLKDVFSEKKSRREAKPAHTKDTTQESYYRTDESSANASTPKSRFQDGGGSMDNNIIADDVKVKDFQDVSIESLENDLIQRKDLSPEDMELNKQALQKMRDEEAWDNEILDCIVEFSKR